MHDSLLICWNCQERTPVGTCIHCGKEVSRADGEKDSEKETKVQYVIQIKQKSGEVKEFSIIELEEIVKRHFDITSQHFTPAGPIFVVRKKESQEFSYDVLLGDCEEIAKGLTPLIKVPKNHLKYSRLDFHDDHLIVEFKFIPTEQTSNTFLMKASKVLTFYSVVIAGFLTSMRYSSAIARKETLKMNLQSLYSLLSQDVIINTFLFSIITFSMLMINRFLITYLFRKFGGEEIKVIPLPTLVPYFEIGTLGNLRIETYPHKNKRAMFLTVILPSLTTWLMSVIIFIFSLPLSFSGKEEASIFSENSLIANGYYEPLILRIIAVIGSELGFINSPITSAYVLHPISLAALSLIYIFGIQLLPITQTNGGLLIEIVFGRIVLYASALILMISLFLINLWWLLIVNFFLFRLNIGVPILNEDSELPKFSKFLTIFSLLLGILSLPLPL